MSVNVALISLVGELEIVLEIAIFETYEDALTLEPGYDYYIDTEGYDPAPSPMWSYDPNEDVFAPPPGPSQQDISQLTSDIADYINNLVEMIGEAESEVAISGLSDGTSYASGVLPSELLDAWGSLMDAVTPEEE